MIFGVTRFSVFSPTSNAWKSSREMGVDEYREYLFSDKRLSFRKLILERYSLPIIRKMAGEYSDYHHFFTFSNDLPEKYKEALFSMVEGIDNLHVVEHAHLIPLIRGMVRTSSVGCQGVYALFNLDDDDLVSFDYINCLRKYVKSEFEGWAVSFGLGVSAIYDKDSNRFVDSRECYYPKINIGLALINSYRVKSDGVDLGDLSKPSHTRIDREKTMVLDSKRIMWLWCRHADQDTLVKKDAMSILKSKQDKLEKVSENVLLDRFLVRN